MSIRSRMPILRKLEMRVAVLSDVHANLHALESVLAQVDAGRFDAVWCPRRSRRLRAEANECVALLQSGPRSAWPATTISSCSARFRSRRSAVRQAPRRAGRRGARRAGAGVPRHAAAAGGRTRSRARPRQSTRPGLGVRAHGCGGGERVRADRGAARARRPQSHRARDPERRRPTASRRGRRSSSPGCCGDLNPGSVGQPRDGDLRAAWLEIDFAVARQPSAVPTIRSSRRNASHASQSAGGPGGTARDGTLARPRHRKRSGMAELTNLETKLGEVIGLAMAAQAATERVEKLTTDAKLRKQLKTMRQEAARKPERTAPRSPRASTARRARSSPRRGRCERRARR